MREEKTRVGEPFPQFIEELLLVGAKKVVDAVHVQRHHPRPRPQRGEQLFHGVSHLPFVLAGNHVRLRKPQKRHVVGNAVAQRPDTLPAPARIGTQVQRVTFGNAHDALGAIRIGNLVRQAGHQRIAPVAVSRAAASTVCARAR